jgi:murein DD-endopeptidase MepM/ murein hydrolase activator NlpD
MPEQELRILVILTVFLFFIKAGISQETIILPINDSLVIADSTAYAVKCQEIAENKPVSVYDIHWITNSIKSGWKATDTLLIGEGVEPCDSVHPFIMPVDGKFWRGCTYYHSGWDIGCDHGTPVKAALGGKVRYASYCSGYGKLVIVRHYSGVEMYYAHLSKINVTTNQFIDPGDTLGLVGATGRARGSHLHMEFRLCDRALDIADYYTQDDTLVNLFKITDLSKKQSQPQTAEYHIIVRGDTLYDLANRYDTTVANLCTINQISRNSTLRIGQKIRLK